MHPDVKAALQRGQGVVALESTIISHGELVIDFVLAKLGRPRLRVSAEKLGSTY